MGKSPKPLTILLTDPEMLVWLEVGELRTKGHIVALLSDVELSKVESVEDWDIILGPNCWRMTPALRRYFPQALAAARKARYPKREEVS